MSWSIEPVTGSLRGCLDRRATTWRRRSASVFVKRVRPSASRRNSSRSGLACRRRRLAGSSAEPLLQAWQRCRGSHVRSETVWAVSLARTPNPTLSPPTSAVWSRAGAVSVHASVASSWGWSRSSRPRRLASESAAASRAAVGWAAWTIAIWSWAWASSGWTIALTYGDSLTSCVRSTACGVNPFAAGGERSRLWSATASNSSSTMRCTCCRSRPARPRDGEAPA